MQHSSLGVSSACLWAVAASCALSSGHPASAGERQAAPPEEIILRDALVIGPVGRYRRAPVHQDAVEALIVAGRWSPPNAGDRITLPDGSVRTWEEATAAEDGWIAHEALRGGYAYLTVEAAAEQVMLLDAVGHRVVYVRGEPRAGDSYRTGKVRLPVLFQRGSNELLFLCGRRGGRLKAKLTVPKAAVLLDVRDATLPDLIIGEETPVWGAVVVINASTDARDDLLLEAAGADGTLTRTALPPLPPLSMRKVGFQWAGPAPEEGDACELALRLVSVADDQEQTMDTATLSLNVRHPEDKHKRTFVSEIDGSVQYYAVTPAHPAEDDRRLPALILTLHGAGVEATGQARCYNPKSWGYVVAPTNRRHFGFDWEDWGRLDALEVLAIASRRFNTDPQRTYLTGHSMGGHGVWHVGVTFPDRFAAIGPSAGWISFWPYTGAERYEDATPIERILRRATSPSDTLSLSRNYRHHGVYILHGEKDDNVPVKQARTMRQHLAEFHTDFAYYERPGAGHWWGNACVDWEPMFTFFEQHTRPASHAVRFIEFATASPGVSASSHWVTVEAQLRMLELSKVSVRLHAKARRFSGSTENVARLVFDLEELGHARWEKRKNEWTDVTALPPGEPFAVELDGQKIEDIPWPTGALQVRLSRDGDQWTVTGDASPALKGPHRYGPFKEAFRNRVMFVYGTAGTSEENAWAFAKARYDAETFWYRGNGSIDVVPDTAFDVAAEPDRNVILYGHADTNAAWPTLLAGSPVHVSRGVVRIGERELAGDNLACLFIRPRPNSDRALVGVVTGSGLPGLRLTERLPYFVSGVAYPDCTVFGPEVLTDGAAGIRVAGFFGEDWSTTAGEFAWGDSPAARSDERAPAQE